MYSNPSNYDVNWPEDIILIYTGILGEEDKDFRDFLTRYPNNPHIFSHLDQFQLSEGLMNEYGSFPEGQTPWWQYIEYFEPSRFYTDDDSKHVLGGYAGMFAEFLDE